MQTFVPYTDDTFTAQCLDDRRLLKQMVECSQIIRALEDSSYGWQNHPAVKMWRGHVLRLANYAWSLQIEFMNRRGKVVNVNLPVGLDESQYCDPPWWGGEIHASHRANLLRKMPDHYGKFGWTEDPSTPYVWPI